MATKSVYDVTICSLQRGAGVRRVAEDRGLRRFVDEGGGFRDDVRLLLPPGYHVPQHDHVAKGDLPRQVHPLRLGRGVSQDRRLARTFLHR